MKLDGLSQHVIVRTDLTTLASLFLNVRESFMNTRMTLARSSSNVLIASIWCIHAQASVTTAKQPNVRYSTTTRIKLCNIYSASSLKIIILGFY